MRLKLKQLLLSVSLMVFILGVYGCAEEPVIDPVQRPFSVVRLGNFTNNVANMSVAVYNRENQVFVTQTLAQGSFSAYFDVPSGKRRFVVTDLATNQVILNKEIEISSFERLTVCFGGHNDPVNTDFNTLNNFEIEEGEVYVSSAPATGGFNLYVIHASGDNQVDVAPEVGLQGKFIFNDTLRTATLISAANALKFANARTIGRINTTTFNAAASGSNDAGDYELIFRRVTGGAYRDTLALRNETFQAGMRYYMVVYGDPAAVTIIKNEVSPPPIRNKN